MQEFDKIYLVWRKGKGHVRYTVGELYKQGSEYVFNYLPKAKELQKEGFAVYTEFQNLETTYKVNVLQIFGQRLTKSTRPDIQNLYHFWEIDETKKDDVFYMLGKTQALLATDNFELIPSYKTEIPLTFITEVVGLTHNKVEKGIVQIGDVLDIEKENSNIYDANAIKVFKDKHFVGYIKAVHCQLLAVLDLSKVKVVVKAIDQNGILKRIFVKIEIGN